MVGRVRVSVVYPFRNRRRFNGGNAGWGGSLGHTLQCFYEIE